MTGITMTIILQDQTDRTTVLESDPNDACLAVGAQFHHAALPRSLEEDRQFIANMSDPEWSGVRLAGIETPADIEKVSALLRVVEANRDMAPNTLVILAVLDTAKAALGLAGFNRTIPRLAGLIFDAEVLARASGAAAESALVMDLRLRLPLAARASAVPAFLTTGDDSPETKTKAARDGYNGLSIKEA